ncbi:Arginase/deacetylase [Teratosphaeria nubilosa]|uniref:Arginase/deacetylase n=1 Tax=Teratosphaeria nubilosa TaxID=161662 RepID=A0A6G1LQ27_9PEZI|nr:Arginase/deacetylase [Teratosphaeria nubilosa]
MDAHAKPSPPVAPARRTSSTNRDMPSQTSSPLHFPTPSAMNRNPPRRPSHHAATSPLQADSPRPPASQQNLRRASSAMSLTNRPTSSAGTPESVHRRTSRPSLGEDGDQRPTPKRSISNLIATLKEAQSTMEAIEEPVVLTAPQIAEQHFVEELEAHEDGDADTLLILHDACYGHRYSRLRSTKSALSMIVERPERLLAGVLGASAAYVRLGGHHAQGRNAPKPVRDRREGAPFKIRRTGRSLDVTSSYVTNVHGTEWMKELKGMCHAAADRLASGRKELERPGLGYTEAEMEKRRLHAGDLYLAPESLAAFEGALGGVADAVDAVFKPESGTRKAFVAVRPPGHHCSADHPSGFCWLNNVHVGIEYAAQTYGLTHAAILDFDLHHGDGSQQITWERNAQNNIKRINAKPSSKPKLGPDIGYYSLHDINSYPCEMGDDEKVQAASLCIENAHGQNIWNVHLHPWKTEEEFWELYESRYKVLLEKARAFLMHQADQIRRSSGGKTQPKAAIFISAGFDASEWEGAGMQRHKVNVPTEFYARFTQDVVALAGEQEVACDGRVMSVLEGGYSDRALCSGILSHLSGLCSHPQPAQPSIKAEPGLDEMMRGLQLSSSTTATGFDTTWWSAANLTALELHVNPPPPPGPGRKLKTGSQPTYATPTESFAYKVVDTNKFARSISGTMRQGPGYSRPVTPPAPEVDWIIATQVLSKLLIPTNRTTKSCTAEELAGPKVKKEIKPAPPSAVIGDGARQLRDRTKAKVPAKYAESAHSDETESMASRSVSRASISSRRQTLHDFPISAEEPAQKRTSRRLSAGSALNESGPPNLNGGAPPMPTLNGRGASNRNMKPPPVPAPRGAATGLDLKKTRAPIKAGNPASAKGSAAPSPTTNLSAPSSHQTSRASTPAAQPPLHTSTNVAPSGVDALTSGLKRITLKVGSREEHDRRLREKEAADRRARALKGAETRRVNAAARRERERDVGKTDVDVVGDVPAIAQASANPAEATVLEPVSNAGAVPPAPFTNPDPPAHSLLPTDPPTPLHPGLNPANTDTLPGAPRVPETTTTPNSTSTHHSIHPLHPLHSPSPKSKLPRASSTGTTPQKAPPASPPIPARPLFPEHAPTNGGIVPSPSSNANAERRALPVWSSTGVIPFAAPPRGAVGGGGLVPAFPPPPFADAGATPPGSCAADDVFPG